MKLVNILARDWPTWPYDDTAFVSQDAGRDTAAYSMGDQCVNTNGNWDGDSYISGSLIPLIELADDHLVAIVTYGEWEIARESFTPVSGDGWNGKGWPPTGSKLEIIEVQYPEQKEWLGKIVTVVNTFENQICEEIVTVESDSGDCACFTIFCFRPVRTPEQIAAEERRVEIKHIQAASCGEHGPAICVAAAASLYDAGYRKTDVQ